MSRRRKDSSIRTGCALPLNEEAREFRDAGQPVVSVDAKKEERIGEFKNVGREWEPKGRPAEVGIHDFLLPELGRAIPYGIYDIERNAGLVNLGQDHETGAFAVESLRAGGRATESLPTRRRIGYWSALMEAAATVIGYACGNMN